MKIKKTDKYIEIDGHCETKVCAMVTYGTVTLMKGMTEIIGFDPDFVLKSGHFYLELTNLPADAALLFKVFWMSIEQLAKDYPNEITIE